MIGASLNVIQTLFGIATQSSLCHCLASIREGEESNTLGFRANISIMDFIKNGSLSLIINIKWNISSHSDSILEQSGHNFHSIMNMVYDYTGRLLKAN